MIEIKELAENQTDQVQKPVQYRTPNQRAAGLANKPAKPSHHSALERCQAVLSAWTERRRPSEVCRELVMDYTVIYYEKKTGECPVKDFMGRYKSVEGSKRELKLGNFPERSKRAAEKQSL